MMLSITGIKHALEKRSYQNKTQLRYNLGSVYYVLAFAIRYLLNEKKIKWQ